MCNFNIKTTMKQSKFFLALAVFCLGFLVSCSPDYEKLAKTYVAGQKVSYEDALLVVDGEKHYVLHFDGLQSKKFTGRKLVYHDLDTEETTKLSKITTTEGEIDLTDQKVWGCSKSNNLLYVVATVGKKKHLYNISPYTLKGTLVCEGNDIEVLGDDVIQCRNKVTTYYKWTGDALKTDRYTGTIGKYSTIMDIAFDGEQIYGSYYYKSNGASSQKSLRGTVKGMNFNFTTYNRKRVKQEEFSLKHNGSELVGVCTTVKNNRKSNVRLSFSK